MFCSSCGSAFQDEMSFCPNCGAPANPAAAQQPAQPAQSAQPVYQQPVVQQPIVLQQAEERQENGFAIAGFIISLTCMIFMVFKYVNIIVPATALVFSIIGVSKKNAKRKGWAIAGIILAASFLMGGFSITFG